MGIEPESRRLRAKQVGMLMRAYRHSHSVEGNGRRLSQTGLLDLMGRVDPKYLNRHDHSTVARWESGATRPTRERLEAFGRALNLEPAEIEGLVLLAGLGAAGSSTAEEQAFPAPMHVFEDGKTDTPEHPEPLDIAAAADGDDSSPGARHTMRYVWSRFLLPGSCVALAGYSQSGLLDLMGQVDPKYLNRHE